MTSKLKCPVCTHDLHTTADIFCVCTNDKCKIWGQPIPCPVVVQLIQSQKDLEIARKALKDMMESGGDGYHIARKALEQITHDNSEKANSQEHKEI